MLNVELRNPIDCKIIPYYLAPGVLVLTINFRLIKLYRIKIDRIP